MIKSEILAKNTKIDLLCEIDNSLPVVCLRVVFRASGAVSESKPGLAKLVSRMLCEGTKTLGVSAFYEKLDVRAISLDIDAGFETFVIEINSLKEHFGFALDALCELLRDPNFSDEILEKIKLQTLGEIDMLKSEFDYVAKQGLRKCLYAGTKLADELIGDEASVSEISLCNVREFYSSLTLANAYALVIGDVNGAQNIGNEINDKIKEILECFAVSEARELAKFSASNARKSEILARESEQAYIYFGAPFLVAQDERYIANTALFILGAGGFGSRMMENIRVKNGLAYSVYARANFELSRCEFWGYLQTKNENLNKALTLVKSEIRNFVANGVSADELETAKKFIIGSAVLQKETMFKRANIQASEYYKGLEFGEFERNLERTKALELGRLNDFIRAHSEILDLSVFVLCSDEAKAKFSEDEI